MDEESNYSLCRGDPRFSGLPFCPSSRGTKRSISFVIHRRWLNVQPNYFFAYFIKSCTMDQIFNPLQLVEMIILENIIFDFSITTHTWMWLLFLHLTSQVLLIFFKPNQISCCETFQVRKSLKKNPTSSNTNYLLQYFDPLITRAIQAYQSTNQHEFQQLVLRFLSHLIKFGVRLLFFLN